MNKCLFFTIIFSAFAFSASAQTEISTAPVNWERYKVSDSNISIMLPKMPIVFEKSDVCNEVKRYEHFAYAEQVVYEFTVTSKSEGKFPFFCLEKRNFGDINLVERLAELRGDEKNKEDAATTRGDRQIYKFVRKYSTRWVMPDMAKNRWIELAITRREDTKPEEDRFLGSLKVSGSDGKEIGQGVKSTLGDAAFKAEIISDNKREKLLTDGAFIVAKTLAKYTDSARRANIQGHVLIKVELQANGGIGIVTPVKELSDGLTEQAIAAARKIVFLPKRIGGIPVTVVQTFDYGFSIY